MQTSDQTGEAASPKWFALAPIALLLALSGCAYAYGVVGHPAVNTNRDLAHTLRAAPDPEGPNKIIVSGGVVHSSWGISDIKTVRKNDTVYIKMHMRHAGLGRTNLQENFKCVVDVSQGVNSIRVGKDKALVWSRQEHPEARKGGS